MFTRCVKKSAVAHRVNSRPIAGLWKCLVLVPAVLLPPVICISARKGAVRCCFFERRGWRQRLCREAWPRHCSAWPCSSNCAVNGKLKQTLLGTFSLKQTPENLSLLLNALKYVWRRSGTGSFQMEVLACR